MSMQIPLYRAKKIDSDGYVEGFYKPLKDFETKCLKCNSLDVRTWSEYDLSYAHCNNCTFGSSFHDDCFEHGYIGKESFFIWDNQGDKTEIDPSTLAIHFPDMFAQDSDKLLPNGDKDLRIFASLSKDGRGGDIIRSIYKDDVVAIWCGYPTFRLEYKKISSKHDREFNELSPSEIRITGIQK